MYELVNKLTSRQRIFVQASAIELAQIAERSRIFVQASAIETCSYCRAQPKISKQKSQRKQDKILVKDIISKTSLSRLLVFFYTRLLNKPDYLTTKL